MIKRYKALKYADIDLGDKSGVITVGNITLVPHHDGDFCLWKDVNATFDLDGNVKKAWRMKVAESIKEMVDKYQMYLICDRGDFTSRMADTIAQYAAELNNDHQGRQKCPTKQPS